jgi:hypothetical protein
MSAIAVAPSQVAPEPGPGPAIVRVGRAFVHPAFDLLVIGGGLSLLFTAALVWKFRPAIDNVFTPSIAWVALVANQAHFAASTVRLYTKPGARRELRFLSLGFPLVTLAVLSYAVARPEGLGATLTALYLTWSPYHYAAQAYGLALMYSYRSGCALSLREKQVVRAACLAPFVVQFIAGRGFGLAWILAHTSPALDVPWLRAQAALWLTWVPVVLMVGLFAHMAIKRRVTLPLVSLCTVLSNAVWLLWLTSIDAFVYATVFHSIQYLAIVTIFHVKNQQQAGRGGWAFHAAGFYLRCVALGYLLFQLVPLGYFLFGFGLAESVLVVITIINLHHFIVDAYIWRLRQDSNYKLVTAAV